MANLPEESKRVLARLNSLQNFQTSRAASFWANRDKGFPMVLLQDRIEQARNLLGRCRGALDYIHNALFPLNPRLEGIHQMLNNFKDDKRIFKFIHREMISGAMSALAWVKAHHRQIQLTNVAAGLPSASDGGPLDIQPFYEVALEPARKIMQQVHEETRRRRQLDGRDIPEMEGVPEAVIVDINARVPR